jgi:hypothetical protein
MDLRVLDTLFYISLGTILVPIALIFWQFNRQQIAYKLLAVTLTFSFICDLTAEIMYRCSLPVNYASNFYSTVGPLLTSIFLYKAIGWRKVKVPLIIFGCIFFVFSIINLFFIQKSNIATYSSMLGKLLIMVLCLLYFYKLLRELPAEKVERLGLFWIISSILFGTSARLILFSFVQYLITYKDNLILLWSIGMLITIVHNLLIAYGVFINFRAQGRHSPLA